MLLFEGKWIMNSSRLIIVRGGPRPKNKNYGEVGKTEGKFLNDNPLRGRYSVKFYCE